VKKWLGRMFKAVEDRIRLPEMMKLRGASLPAHKTQPDVLEAARAIERCERCNAKELCDAYLEAGNPDSYRGFCPNAAYIESLRDKARELN
jgi:hypothetical protein